MGTGRSGAGSSKNSSSASTSRANTPSGISHQQFMAMSEQQRWQTIDNIIADQSITTPDYLDNSDVSKVMYALGMNNKMNVVSDSQLDNMPGREIFRTVYETGMMPPPSSDAILDQIRNGDYTQMSGRGGSAHGRAIYFATNFTSSTVYGDQERNAMVMRARISPNAKIVSESNLLKQMRAKGYRPQSTSGRDDLGLYAISQGIDGWYQHDYTMIINRGNITASSQNRRISGRNSKGISSATATTWQGAAIAR